MSPFLDPHRERVDRHVRADELMKGDQLHLTFMGGDDYVTVDFKRSYRGVTTVRWDSYGGEVEDRISNDTMVWVKK